MSDPTPTTATPPVQKSAAKPAPGPTDLGKTISVRVLVFARPHPSFNAQSSIAAESAVNKRRITIDFVPALRHHRVETHRPDGAPRVQFIPEGFVADWEPA